MSNCQLDGATPSRAVLRPPDTGSQRHARAARRGCLPARLPAAVILYVKCDVPQSRAVRTPAADGGKDAAR